MNRLALIIFILLLTASPAMAGEDGTTTLKESVVSAVKQHPQIKSLLHNRDAMASNLKASLGRFFPSLNLTANHGYQSYSSSTTRGAGTDHRRNTASDSTLTMTQNVFDGMNRYNDYEGSKARLTSAEYRLIDNVETVALDAIRAHIDVVRERALIALAEENIVAHQEVLASIAERVAGGAGSKADEMQARGRVARAETTLISYTGSLHTAEAEYVRVTSMTPGPLDDPEYLLEEPTAMESAIEFAMAENPKLKILKAEIEATERDKDVKGANFYPNVDLELSTRNTDNLDGATTYIRDNKAMISVSWNLFNGGTDYNDLKAAKSRVNEAQEDLQDTVDDLTRQVATAWTQYDTAVKSIDKHLEALHYSMESRDMYMMQFNVGQRSLLDVLDSINEVFSNSVLLETAQSNRNFTMYKILALEGRLVNSMEVADNSYDPQAQ